VHVVTGSKEYLQFPVYGPAGVDLTAFPVEVAIVTEAHGEPDVADPAWTAAAWTAGLVTFLILPGALPAGDYVVYARVTAGAEKPVLESGRLRIGPAV
jgi:hypothetical protein